MQTSIFYSAKVNAGDGFESPYLFGDHRESESLTLSACAVYDKFFFIEAPSQMFLDVRSLLRGRNPFLDPEGIRFGEDFGQGLGLGEKHIDRFGAVRTFGQVILRWNSCGRDAHPQGHQWPKHVGMLLHVFP